MVRRSALVVASVVAVLLAFPAVAAAEYRAQLVAPDSGVVTGPVEVRVRVSRDLVDPDVRAVQVRAADAERSHPAECVADCRSRDPVFAFGLDPGSGVPFSDGALQNGTFELEVVVSRAIGADRSAGRVPLSLKVPGSAVGGLSATVADGEVRVAWRRAPEPDISGYRVERCTDGCDADGGWTDRTDLPASATSLTERPGPGTHGYRVVTVRSAGGDGTIETVSSPVAAEVARPPRSTASEEDGRDGATPTAAPTGRVPARTEVDSGDVGGPAERPANGAPDAGTDRRASDDRGSPSVRLPRSGAGIPELPLVGELFRTTLDYGHDRGAVDQRRPDPERDAGLAGGEVVVAAPSGSVGGLVGRLTDPERVAVPVAGGLLLTAAGLHLARWSRLPGTR